MNVNNKYIKIKNDYKKYNNINKYVVKKASSPFFHFVAFNFTLQLIHERYITAKC